MYFWKIDNLKKDLVNEKVTEKDLFCYLLIPAVFIMIMMELALWLPPEEGNHWDLILSVSNVLICFLGLIYCFVKNGGGMGKDFLKRYVSVSFVMAIRLTVFMIPAFFLIYTSYFFIYPDDTELVSTAIDTVPYIGMYVWYFWRVANHIRDVKDQ